MELNDLAIKYATDKYSHGYCEHYLKHLPPKDAVFNLLEIGIFHGGSLKMWKDYYPNANIFGIDIEQQYMFTEERIVTFCGNATSADFINSLDLPEMSIIIDDGSHQAVDIVKTFELLYSKVPVGGVYVIEDLLVQWWGQYGGGDNGSPAIRLLEDLLAKTIYTNDTSELHLYTEIAFIKK